MFREHQPVLQAYTSRSTRGFLEAQAMVLATIQEPLERALDNAQAFAELGDTSWAWGNKAGALGLAMADAEERLDRLWELYPDRDAMLLEVASWTGFGPIKGGFLLQITFGLSGCLDRRNVARLGLDIKPFRASRFKKASPSLRRQIVEEYHALVDRCGGTEALWDEWCEDVAEARPDPIRGWHTARDVSEAHMLALTTDIPF
jgi:hypothetical protein